MSTIIHLIAKKQKKEGARSLFSRLAHRFTALSENFWFLLSFALFVIMGPFSIIAVIIGIYSLAKDQKNKEAPEPASL